MACEGSIPNITDCRRTDCSKIPRVESGKAWEGITLMYYIVYFPRLESGKAWVDYVVFT
jgi:hypothetical protein